MDVEGRFLGAKAFSKRTFSSQGRFTVKSISPAPPLGAIIPSTKSCGEEHRTGIASVATGNLIVTAAPFVTLYPSYNVLNKWRSPSFNEQSRQVLQERLQQVPPRRFFNEAEWATLESVCARVLPQDQAPGTIMITPWIDASLHDARTTGTRYEGLPPNPECWRRGLCAIDSESLDRFGRTYASVTPDNQDLVLTAMDQRVVQSKAWKGLESRIFLRKILLPAITEVYYAHPDAWSEIGFGGPASPRGYVRLAANRRDPWEAPKSVSRDNVR